MKLDEHSVISTIQAGSNPEAPEPSENIDERTAVLVNMVFSRFKAIFGTRFESTFGTKDAIEIAKREWALCLIGVSEGLLAQALHRCKTEFSWPPSIAEFLKLLKPDTVQFGLPDTRAAFLQAVSCRVDPKEFNWSHPAVYYAAKATEFFRLKTASEAEIWPVFEKHYGAICERVIAGEQLDIPSPIALEDKSDVTRAIDIQSLADSLGLDTGFLYYLSKPKGTTMRKSLRAMAIKQLNEANVSEDIIQQLPA